MSQAQLSKLEGSQKTLTRNDLDRYLEQLADHTRAERFSRLKGGG